jgi:D-amino peptidase
LTAEVNAAVDGAMAAGASDVVVNDSHGAMANLDPRSLAGGATYLSGRHKPGYMMEGLDASFDAIVFLGYHAAMATPGVLSHTYNPRAITNVTINGRVTGEAGLNALVAQHFRVPIVAISGDQHVGPEAAPFCPGIAPIQVKTSITRYAARHEHPLTAREMIRDGVAEALRRSVDPPAIEMPATIEIEFLSPDMAAQATWIRDVTHTGSRTVALRGDDPMGLFQAFISIVYLTRSLVETR